MIKMAERDLAEQLNRAVDAILSGSSVTTAEGSPLEDMALIAASLRGLSGQEFRAQLKKQLLETTQQKEKAMTAATTHLRPGFRTVTPYLHVRGAERFIEFLKQAFDAEEVMRTNRPDGTIMHAEVTVGDSRIELSDVDARPTAIHLYVPDVDAAYQRALGAGGTSLHPLTDQPYGDREGSVQDPFGNFWYIATHQGGSYVPEGLHSVTPYLHPVGTSKVIDFLQEAFGAEEIERHASPEGTVMHAKIRVGDSIIEMGEAHDQWQPMPCALHLYVDDADALYQRALRAGATSLYPPNNTPYGDRGSGVTDPFGNQWYIHTYTGQA